MLTKSKTGAVTTPVVCAERERLADQLREALDHLGLAARNAREPGGGEAHEDLQSTCARIWMDLQRHQVEHRCWRERPQPRSSGPRTVETSPGREES
jgi:hypothetical protein